MPKNLPDHWSHNFLHLAHMHALGGLSAIPSMLPGARDGGTQACMQFCINRGREREQCIAWEPGHPQSARVHYNHGDALLASSTLDYYVSVLPTSPPMSGGEPTTSYRGTACV